MNSVYGGFGRSRGVKHSQDFFDSIGDEPQRAASYFRRYYNPPMDLTTLRINYWAWIRRELGPGRRYDCHRSYPHRNMGAPGHRWHQTLPRAILTYPTYPRRVEQHSRFREERAA
jgi:hypothetical protein